MTTSSPLDICHVQPLSLDLFGHDDDSWGTSTRYFLPNIAFAQRDQGHRPQVHILTSGRPHRIVVNGVPVHFHRCLQPPVRVGVNRRFARQISRTMVQAAADTSHSVVHLHGARSLHTMLGLCAWSARRAGVPFVSQDHGVRQPRLGGRWLGPSGLRSSAAVMAANEQSLIDFTAAGLPSDRQFFIPNGVDASIFGIDGPVAARPDDRFLVLVVSRMWADKDPLTMARAVAQVQQSGHQLAVRIISEGPLRDEVVGVLRTAGVHVEAIDRVDQHELAAHYRSADALILTSLREGFNQTTVEAMACGLPVIGTDIPGIREGVGDAGLLVQVGDVDGVAAALTSLVTDQCRRDKLRQAGPVQSRQFTWEGVVEELESVYRFAMEHPVPRR